MINGKMVEVTVSLEGAWESYRVEVPADADEEWVKNNWQQCDPDLHESGADRYLVTEIDMRDEPKEQEVIVDVEP